MLLVYTGRHKAASSWSRFIFRDVAAAFNLPILTVISPQQWAEYGSLGEMIRQKKPWLVSLTNAQQQDYDTLPPRRTVNVIRDPRDIVISGYFSHRNSHLVEALGITWHELIEHRKRLLELNVEDGILEEIEFSGVFLDPMASWNYSQPEVLELKMEELVADPVRVWTRIFEHYELLVPHRTITDRLHTTAMKWNVAPQREEPHSMVRLRKVLPRVPLRRLPHGYIPMALEHFTFAKMSGSDRKPGEVDEMNHYRKGVPGDWRNYFTDRHVKAFRERYGDLVERLGYPPD